MARFVFDPDFADVLARAPRGTSLAPLGDRLRTITDQVRDRAIALAEADATAAEALAAALLPHRRELKDRYDAARVTAWSLRSYSRLVKATMHQEPDGLAGRVTAHHRNADVIEYGGTERHTRVGGPAGGVVGSAEDPGGGLVHPPRAYLRRAFDQTG